MADDVNSHSGMKIVQRRLLDADITRKVVGTNGTKILGINEFKKRIQNTSIPTPMCGVISNKKASSVEGSLGFQLTDFTETTPVFLNKSAYECFGCEAEGTVIIIIPPYRLSNGCISVSIIDSILVVGKSKDFGYCEGNRLKDNERCRMAINKSLSRFCCYHNRHSSQHSTVSTPKSSSSSSSESVVTMSVRSNTSNIAKPIRCSNITRKPIIQPISRNILIRKPATTSTSSKVQPSLDPLGDLLNVNLNRKAVVSRKRKLNAVLNDDDDDDDLIRGLDDDLARPISFSVDHDGVDVTTPLVLFDRPMPVPVMLPTMFNRLTPSSSSSSSSSSSPLLLMEKINSCQPRRCTTTHPSSSSVSRPKLTISASEIEIIIQAKSRNQDLYDDEMSLQVKRLASHYEQLEEEDQASSLSSKSFVVSAYWCTHCSIYFESPGPSSIHHKNHDNCVQVVKGILKRVFVCGSFCNGRACCGKSVAYGRERFPTETCKYCNLFDWKFNEE